MGRNLRSEQGCSTRLLGRTRHGAASTRRQARSPRPRGGQDEHWRKPNGGARPRSARHALHCLSRQHQPASHSLARPRLNARRCLCEADSRRDPEAEPARLHVHRPLHLVGLPVELALAVNTPQHTLEAVWSTGLGLLSTSLTSLLYLIFGSMHFISPYRPMQLT
jgi:hypothetical protein